jgi:hypothetical protein
VQTDIASFLQARLADEQRLAEEATGRVEIRYLLGGRDSPAIARMLFHRHFNPARVLAEVAAKRAIVEFCRDDPPFIEGGYVYTGRVLELLAAPYADHPEYDPAWSPDAPH